MTTSNIKGHWTVVFEPQGSETAMDFTASATAKQLSMRPICNRFKEIARLIQNQS